MARIRTIKPDFWTDEKLTECSLSARLLFIGTWNFADDNGNLDRSAKQIKARVFPLDNIDCEPLLQELISQGLLTEYSVNEKIYFHIQGFAKHQLINRPSKPVCPEFDESLKIDNHSVSAHTSLITEGKGREGKVKEVKPLMSISTKPTYDDYPEFLEFWSAYPRKDDKKKSFESWIKAKPNIDNVLKALSWQIKSEQWTKDGGQFIPLGETYINGARWEAEPPKERAAF
jgi:hypothetical protein